MKKFGTTVAVILGTAVIALVAWLGIAGFQGKTLKDTIPEQEVQQEVENDNVQNEETNTETAACFSYDAQNNVINLI